MLATLVRLAQELARYEGKKRGWDEDRVLLHRLCQNAAKGKDVPKVAVIDLTQGTIHLEDYKEDERHKYLYALSTGNTAFGPSWLLDFGKKKTRDEVIKTGIKKINEVLKSLDKSKSQELEKSIPDVQTRVNEVTRSESLVLVTIMQDGQMPGERAEFRKAFIRKRVLGERRAKVRGSGCCAICGAEGEVSSAIPLPFFTVEKLGFSPMGREEHVWKYAPICDECAKWLCIAESYLDENLSTRVAGKSAYLLPDLEPGVAEIEGSFVYFLWEWRERMEGKTVPEDHFPQNEKPKRAKSKKAGDADGDSRPNLFEGLVEESDKQFQLQPPFRSASLVFYQPGQKFMLLYTISEILPENLRRAKERLAALREQLRGNVLGREGAQLAQSLKGDFEFVGRAWKWPRSGQNESQGTVKLTPMHLVEAILTEQCPPEREFWQDADSLLRAVYQETVSSKDQKQTVQGPLAERARLIWTIWVLVYRSKLLEGGTTMTTPSPAGARGATEAFWEDFFKPKLLLDSPAKRAAFLVGVLFGQVEGRQRTERANKAGEMPIISRLRGLAVSREEIMAKIFPELMLKLRQLDANTQAIRTIQEAAAGFAAQDGELSDEEARFCFCLGWALSWATVEAVPQASRMLTGPEARDETGLEESARG